MSTIRSRTGCPNGRAEQRNSEIRKKDDLNSHFRNQLKSKKSNVRNQKKEQSELSLKRGVPRQWFTGAIIMKKIYV